MNIVRIPNLQKIVDILELEFSFECDNTVINNKEVLFYKDEIMISTNSLNETVILFNRNMHPDEMIRVSLKLKDLTTYKGMFFFNDLNQMIFGSKAETEWLRYVKDQVNQSNMLESLSKNLLDIHSPCKEC